MQISSGSFISLSHSHVNNRYLASGPSYRRPIAETDEEMSGEIWYMVTTPDLNPPENLDRFPRTLDIWK